ncbi:MAG: hypothetical protein Q8S33_01260 [Myxococcales bacterium]|nr:hypothetical protein [Myxococcales bacterium]
MALMRVVSLLVLGLTACREAPVGHQLEGPLFVPAALPECVPSASVRCGTEAVGLLDRPHSGIASFHRFADGLPLSKTPRARVAYERFYWSEFEPRPGEPRFDLVDASLEQAHAQGQTWAFRVMPEGDGPQRVPAWLAESAGGSWGSRNGGPRAFSPDYDAPAFLEAVERTVAALGARYDGDPRLDHVDVGFVGDAGEWAYALSGRAMPSTESTRRILDAFVRAFRKTPVVMLLGSVDDEGLPLKEALQRGMGWRADCWGDLRRGWNHHDDFYAPQLEKAGALETWKQSLVTVETCGETEVWGLLGYSTSQVRWLLKWALDHHVTLINNKSRAIPAEWRASFDEFGTYAGARFFVFRATTQTSGVVTVELFNRGTAPLYWPARLALRQRVGDSVALTVRAYATLTRVLPGPFSASFMMPPAPAGATLEVAIVDEAGAVVMPLANEGAVHDGWLAL